MKEEGHAPKKHYGDKGYGSNKNFEYAAQAGIELVAPAPSQPEGKVGLEQCKMDENNVIVECPAGNHPMSAYYRKGKGKAIFHIRVCSECPLLSICRSMKSGKQNRYFKYGDSHLRTRARRLREATPEFKKNMVIRDLQLRACSEDSSNLLHCEDCGSEVGPLFFTPSFLSSSCIILCRCPVLPKFGLKKPHKAVF